MKKLLDIANNKTIAIFTALGKVLGPIAIIVGATLWLDARFDNQSDSRILQNTAIFDSIAEVKQIAEWNNIELGFQAEAIQNINDTLEKFESENKAQGEKINDIVWLIENQNNYSQDQLDALIDRMLKKNSMMKDTTWDFPWRVEPNTELILSDLN